MLLDITAKVIVNLIPYNPFDGNPHNYKTPSAERVDEFLQHLVEAGWNLEVWLEHICQGENSPISDLGPLHMNSFATILEELHSA